MVDRDGEGVRAAEPPFVAALASQAVLTFRRVDESETCVNGGVYTNDGVSFEVPEIRVSLEIVKIVNPHSPVARARENPGISRQ